MMDSMGRTNMKSAFVETIRRANPIKDVAQGYCMEFVTHKKAKCLFSESHKNGDTHPSVGYDEGKQRIRCFSQACFGEKGVDIFGFVMQMEKAVFLEAVQFLATRAGIPIEDAHRVVGNGKVLPRCRSVDIYDYYDRDGLPPSWFYQRYSNGKLPGAMRAGKYLLLKVDEFIAALEAGQID